MNWRHRRYNMLCSGNRHREPCMHLQHLQQLNFKLRVQFEILLKEIWIERLNIEIIERSNLAGKTIRSLCFILKCNYHCYGKLFAWMITNKHNVFFKWIVGFHLKNLKLWILWIMVVSESDASSSRFNTNFLT